VSTARKGLETKGNTDMVEALCRSVLEGREKREPPVLDGREVSALGDLPKTVSVPDAASLCPMSPAFPATRENVLSAVHLWPVNS